MVVVVAAAAAAITAHLRYGSKQILHSRSSRSGPRSLASTFWRVEMKLSKSSALRSRSELGVFIIVGRLDGPRESFCVTIYIHICIDG